MTSKIYEKGKKKESLSWKRYKNLIVKFSLHLEEKALLSVWLDQNSLGLCESETAAHIEQVVLWERRPSQEKLV